MKTLQEAMGPILSHPTPESLVDLQGALLVSGPKGDAVDRTLEIAGHFHVYLSDLRSKIAARDYSELASRLDIGAVGLVALENMVVGEQEKFWQRLLFGALGEVLMVAASRQYVKGWQIETRLVHEQATWFLAEALWQASREMEPKLEPEPRWQAIQGLLAPAHDANVPAPDKAVLLGRIFQLLLITYLARLLPGA